MKLRLLIKCNLKTNYVSTLLLPNYHTYQSFVTQVDLFAIQFRFTVTFSETLSRVKSGLGLDYVSVGVQRQTLELYRHGSRQCTHYLRKMQKTLDSAHQPIESVDLQIGQVTCTCIKQNIKWRNQVQPRVGRY